LLKIVRIPVGLASWLEGLTRYNQEKNHRRNNFCYFKLSTDSLRKEKPIRREIFFVLFILFNNFFFFSIFGVVIFWIKIEIGLMFDFIQDQVGCESIIHIQMETILNNIHFSQLKCGFEVSNTVKLRLMNCLTS